MNQSRESILSASIRAFFVALFALVGLGVALVVLTLILSLVIGESEITQTYTVKVLPDAEGKREALGWKIPVILQLNIHGVIGTDDLTTAKVYNRLVESREGDLKKDRVKAVLVSINSPGGTVSDADGIYRAINDYKEKYKVPVVAYIDGLGASGGIYVAAAADKIVASDVSIVGSVGVISPPFFNVTDLMEKIGVEALTIFGGKGKDELNPFRPWTKDEGDAIHAIISYYYQFFVDLLTKARPQLNREKLVADYGAKVFPAVEAQEMGFIDSANYSREDAIKLLLAQAKLDGQDYRVVELEGKSWASELFQSRSPLLTGKIQHQLMLGEKFDPNLIGKFLYLYRP